MGRKGSWLSAIKRVFLPDSKEKPINQESERKSGKERKKWGLGKLKHGDTNSFIPLYREPSSIEKILGDAERDQQHKIRPGSSDHRKTPPSMHPSVVNHHKEVNHKPTTTPKNHHKEVNNNPTPTAKNHYVAAAIKIQAAFKGYMARRSFRALKGLVRLQGVMRGQSVKRQTMEAMRQMQLLVKVQNQIHSRRIQILENQALQRHNLYKGDKELESSFGITQPSETGQQEEWDDSLLTKEEIEGRLQKKVEAVMKRERAVAYAYSHQLWKATPKSAQTALMEIRSGGFPWWWNWLERQLAAHPSESQAKATGVKNDLTPPKLILEPAVRQPQSSNHTKPSFRYETLDTVTPKSFKPSVAMRTKQVPTLSNRASSTTPVKHAKLRTSGAESSLDTPFRDDDSLTSCPPFSVPNYMVPTVSAKAKVRAYSNLRERFPATSNHEQKRRLSFPLTQSIGSIRWNKGSLFSNKDYDSQKVLGKHRSTQSIGNMSVDSTVSLPAGVGRKAFK